MKTNKLSLLFITAVIVSVFTSGCGKQPEKTGMNDSTNKDTKETTTTTKDETQSGPAFSKELSLQDISFKVTSVKKGDSEEVTITPSGLSVSNEPIMLTIKGKVVNAEIEDMDADGSPEVLVYSQSSDNQKGSVVGVSALNGKSLGLISFIDAENNNKISTGYNGYDEFSMVERKLVQRFPVYENGQKTDKMRQVQYKLEPGEATKVLTVEKVTE